MFHIYSPERSTGIILRLALLATWLAWPMLVMNAAVSESNADADGARRVLLNDPAIFLSPYCWRLDAHGGAVCPVGGGYIKFQVTGTRRLALRVDTTLNRGLPALQRPAIKVVISGPKRDGVAQYYLFPPEDGADLPLSLADGLDPALPYQVRIQATGGDETQMNGWTGTIFQTRIQALVVDADAKLTAAPLRPKRALFLGASYEQAYFGAPTANRPIYEVVDASLSWPFFAAFGLDCEYGQVGIGSQGWARFGNGGYPPFPKSWDHFDETHAKTFGRDLDYIFVHLAENDAAQPDAAVEYAVRAWIGEARRVFGPATRIFIILSLPQIKSAPIRAGMQAAADPHTYILDPGHEFEHVVFSGGPTWAAPGDGIHLDAIHQALFTAFVVKQAQASLDRD